MKCYPLFTWFIILIAGFGNSCIAQVATEHDAAKKARSILSTISLNDAAKQAKIYTVLVAHFDSLNFVFTERKTVINSVVSTANKEVSEARIRVAWDQAGGKLNKLHAIFLGRLSSLLTTAQIEQVKDGMTEGLLHDEYRRFMQLLPTLNEQQKTQVMTYLREARENAMDAETVDMRRQWFIKYRGRANNFLAAAGYDLRKATEELEQLNSNGKKDISIK